MRSSLSGSGPSELASEVAVPEREEEACGAVEMAIVGLISGISGVHSVTKWLTSPNSMTTDTGEWRQGWELGLIPTRKNPVAGGFHFLLIPRR